MNRIRTATVAALLASFVGLQAAPAMAQGKDRRDRYEDKRDRWEDRRDHNEDRRDQREDRYDARDNSWDAARSYRRDSNRSSGRPMGRNDRVYRGSDNRYYCERDDGTTGLIVGGVAGGVLGNIIAPGGWKTVGTIIGAGSGAVILQGHRRWRDGPPSQRNEGLIESGAGRRIEVAHIVMTIAELEEHFHRGPAQQRWRSSIAGR